MKRIWQLAMWAARLRCPRCGRGRLFRRWLRMHEACDACHLKYERAPGYFLGAIYFNYGLTALVVAVAYPVLMFGFEIPNERLLWGGLAFCVLFPLCFFRHARSFWMAFDQFFDPSGPSDGT